MSSGSSSRDAVGERSSKRLTICELLGRRRIVHRDPHQEPVALRLRERVDPLGLDGVLRGDHDEGTGCGHGPPADRDLSLLHHFEQGRLHLGRRTVDLVREDDVGEHGARLDVERFARRPVDPRAHDVGRDQVGRELDA